MGERREGGGCLDNQRYCEERDDNYIWTHLHHYAPGKECWFCHTCVLDPISPQSTYYWCECVSQRKYTDVWFAKFEEERKRTRLTSAIVLALLTTSMNPVFGPVAMQPYGMRQRSDSPSSSHSCNTQISS